MPLGIEGSYNSDATTLELLQRRSSVTGQQDTANNLTAAEITQQPGTSEDNPAQIRLQASEQLDSPEAKHSRHIIDTYA
jgi:hypothetical protein